MATNRETAGFDSPSAEARCQALDDALSARRHDLLDALVSMLADEAPILTRDGWIIEVRDVALAVLEKLHRLARRAPCFGPITHRPRLRASEAIVRARLAIETLADGSRLLGEVDQFLDARVRCSPDERSALRAQRILVELGKLPAVTEEIDPATFRTELQKQVARSAAYDWKPLPFLRVAEAVAPELVVGWVYETPGGWTFWPSEPYDPSDAGPFFYELLHGLDPRGVPRVVHRGGRPAASADGSLVLDGVVALTGGDPGEMLRSLAAFAEPTFTVVVVEQVTQPDGNLDFSVIPD